MTLNSSEKFLVPKGTFGKDFRRLVKLWQSHRVSPSQVELRRLELVLRNQENAQSSSRMTLLTLGKFLVPKGTFGKDFQRLAKPHSQSKLSQGDLEHCLLVMVTKVQTQRSHLGQ